MSRMQGVNQAASTSSSTSKSTALEKIEFRMSRKPFFPLNGSNFKTQNRYTSDPPRCPNANLESGLGNDVKFHMIVRRIGAGLENLGNTCFLNSVLQCLTHTEPLVAYLLSGKHQNSCHIVGFCALCAIQKHVVRSLQSSGRILAPKDLVSNLRRVSRNFRNARQEDAHEYMVHLLESMHKCCLPSGIPYESPSAYEKSLVHKIFGGCLRSQVKCMQCSYCSNKFDPFLDLSLEIAKADSLHKALSHFTAAEQLDGGERQYQCQQCKEKVRASKQLTIDKAPYVLTIHLKRFGSHISGQKIDKKVHFGPTLNLKPYVSGSYGDELKYTLYGVLVHAGWSTHSGHYYCFVRTSGGVWYNLDDSRVYQVSERTVLEQKAYMLFYVRDGMSFGPRSIGNAAQSQKILPSNMPNGSNFKTTPHAYTFADKPVNAVQIKAGAVAAENSLSPGSAANQELQNKSGGSSDIGVPNEKGAAIALQKRGGESDSEGRLQNAMPAKKLRGIDAPNDDHVDSHSSNTQSSDRSYTRKDLVQEPDSKDLSQPSIESKDNDLVVKSNVQHLTHLSKCVAVDPHTHNDAATTIQQNISVVSAEKTLKSDLVSVVKSSGKPADIVDDMMMRKSLVKAGIPPEESVAKQLDGKHDVGGSGREVNSMDGLLSKPPKRSSDQKVRRKSLKYKVPSMRLCTRMLYGASLSSQERRKHRKFQKVGHKVSRNPTEEDSAPSTSHLTAAVEVASRRSRKGPCGSGESRSNYAKHNGTSPSEDFVSELKRRMTVSSAVPAFDYQHLEISEMPVISKQHQSGQPFRSKESMNTMRVVVDNPIKNTKRSVAALRGSVILPSSQHTDGVSIGYVADERDEEYDRGKRKKVKTSKEAFGGSNPFQEVAKNAGKSKVKRKQYNLANQPYRI